jgi:hypothetical protein
MKTTFISLIALGVAVAMAGPADRALAEPMVLTDAQLDRVTAGDGVVLEDILVTKELDNHVQVSVGFSVSPRAILNHNFLGGFELNPDGTYVKSVPEGGFDRAVR